MGAGHAQQIAVEHGASCHIKKQTASNLKLPAGMACYVPEPSGMMKDCPLGVNATAATSKSGISLPEPGRGPVTALPSFEKQTLHTVYARVVPFLHNRGSTHLRCCVFLI
jgi:hypothetical protein